MSASERIPRPLDPIEQRILGALMEKQQTTPEYYPLTMNALLAACNQKSNREPVMELAEADVAAALDRLREFVLVWQVGGSRTEKWEHNLDRKLGLSGPAKAILTLLFLRGPQTPGEIRTRSDRLHAFAALEDVESALASLTRETDPLVVELARRPGQKETRFAHRLGSDVAEAGPVSGSSLPHAEPVTDRVAALETRLAALEAEVRELKSRLGES